MVKVQFDSKCSQHKRNNTSKGSTEKEQTNQLRIIMSAVKNG